MHANEDRRAVLVATLGTKPQVVTTATDLLLRTGFQLSEVRVLYTGGNDEPMASSLAHLQTEFAVHHAYQSLQLRLEPLAGAGGPLADVATEADARQAFGAIYRVILNVKRAGHRLHVSVVGGRKVLAAYGMAAAQLLFDDDDYLWYVLTSGQFYSDERLHPQQSDDAKLIRIPVLRWGAISPVLTDISQLDDPYQAIERQRERRLREQLDEARGFVLGVLSEAERRVVEVLVREGIGDSEIGARLSLSPRTVERHLGEAYAKAAVHWDIPAVNRTQLVRLLGLYYGLHAGPEIEGNPA